MLTDDQIAELRELSEKPTQPSKTSTDEYRGIRWDQLAALLDERDLLLKIADAAGKATEVVKCEAHMGPDECDSLFDLLDTPLAAWRAARDGRKEST